MAQVHRDVHGDRGVTWVRCVMIWFGWLKISQHGNKARPEVLLAYPPYSNHQKAGMRLSPTPREAVIALVACYGSVAFALSIVSPAWIQFWYGPGEVVGCWLYGPLDDPGFMPMAGIGRAPGGSVRQNILLYGMFFSAWSAVGICLLALKSKRAVDGAVVRRLAGSVILAYSVVFLLFGWIMPAWSARASFRSDWGMKGASYWRSMDQPSYVLEGWDENLKLNAVKILTVILGCLGLPISVVISGEQFNSQHLRKVILPAVDAQLGAGRP